jgi:hypothetical protein
MASTSQPNPERPNSLAEKGRDFVERQMEPLNAETRFHTDADENIKALAREAKPGNPQEQERYANKIKASLQAHLKDDVSIEQLWSFLKTEYCQTTSIIEGILRFFAGVKGEKEINIEKFLKPIEIKANPLLKTVREQEREQQISATKLALNDLLSEIKAGNPSLA